MRSAWTILSRVALLAAVCAAGVGCPNVTDPPDYTPGIIVSPTMLDFGADTNTLTFTASKTWTSQALPEFTVVANKSWIEVSPTTGSSSGPDDTVPITVTVKRSLMAAGPNTGTVTVSAPGVVQKVVTVTARARMVANFSAQPTLAYVGDTISFVDLSDVAVGEPPITSWLWDFGDGKGLSSEQNPPYSYDSEGLYTVKLTVGNGLISAERQRDNLIQINVKAAPDAEFTVSNTEPQANTAVKFTDLSNPGTAPISSWLWDFGDGTPIATGQNPSHVYTGAASYDVSLTVTTAHGSDTEVKVGYVTPTPVGPAAEFSADNTMPLVNTSVQFIDESFPGTSPITSWLWDFGDGGPAGTGQNPTHIYTGAGSYDVSLTVTTAAGSDTISKPDYITVQTSGPAADFLISDTTPDINTQVVFTDNSDLGTSPSTATYQWDFGDGTTAAGIGPHPHTYDGTSSKSVDLRTYNITLTVETDHGTDTVTKQVILQVEPPAADFTADQTEVAPDGLVQFTDLSTPGTAPGGITGWLWNFGDGSPTVWSTLQNPSHTYAGHETATRKYNVTLKITTDYTGIESSLAKAGYITVWPRTPLAAFSADKTRVVDDLDVIQFTDESPAGPDYITDWLWDFGDGNTSTAQNPTHTYADPGTYTVTLTITNKISQTDAEVKTAYITVYEWTLLDKYLRTDDGEYDYSIAATDSGTGWTAMVIELTSQEWRPDDLSLPDDGLWKHWLTIITPTGTKSLSDTALFMVSGGSTSVTPPSIDPALAALVPVLGAPVVVLSQVPNQPMEFVGDPHSLSRTEDEIVAYTFDQFLDDHTNTDNETWPSYLPMVKSAVKAMDTVQAEFPDVEKFVVTGASKRGWTTWLTGATDTRVVGIMPMVINVLSMGDQMDHHFMAYDGYSEQIRDYDSTAAYIYGNDVISRIQTVPGAALLKVVDPYEYRERFATIPKLEICATGDEFFLPDAAQWYFDDLPGLKRLRYNPNVGHDLGGDYEMAIAAAAPFFYGVAEDEDIPGFTWALTSTGTTSWRLTVTADPAELPSEVKAWTATTEFGYRDFRNSGNGSGVTPTWTSQDISGSGGVYTFDIDEPSGTRWTGVFMELAYSSDTAPSDYIFTTEVFVVPEAMPYADPNP